MSKPDEMGLTPEAAAGYEQYFVPAIFHQWPAVIAKVAGLKDGDDVLDVGCGTGVFSRHALSKVGVSGSVRGIDLSESMLGVARSMAPGVEFQQGNAMDLPFQDAEFDVVISSFMLMFVPEPEKAVSEMMRVLRPEGRLVVGVWESVKRNPVYEKLIAIAKNRIDEEAGKSLAWPFLLGDDGKLLSILEAGGAGRAELGTYSGHAHFPSLEDFVTTEIRSWVLGESVNDQNIAEVVEDSKTELAEFQTEDGAIEFPFDAIIAHTVKQ